MTDRVAVAEDTQWVIGIDPASGDDESMYVEGYYDANGVLHITDMGRMIEGETYQCQLVMK